MKYVLVTGAFGGMGKATVELLRNEGYAVFALDKRIEGEASDSLIPIECDITDEKSIAKAFSKICQITHELQAIIHFAGIYYLDSLVEIEKERFERIFIINVFGPYLINKAFHPLLKKGSRIIVTTSELSKRNPLPFTGLYAVTKGALDRYCYSLAMELQLQDIHVSVIRPGAVKTDMLHTSTDELDRFCEKTSIYQINASNFRDIVNKVEAKYIAPSEVAKKVGKVLKAKRPRFSYNINRNKLLILLDILPMRLRFKIIKNILKKEKSK